MSMLRPTWIEIDLTAITYNVSLVRKRIGPDVQLFAVVKSHGFGCGPALAARAALAGGADALAVGDAGDAEDIRAAGIEAPILLYASTTPDVAAQVAALNVIVTIHDVESLQAFANQATPVEAFMKAEVGLGRLGVLEEDWQTVFDTARASNSLNLTGIYTHLNAPDDPDCIKYQIVVFDRACAAAESQGFKNLTQMVASSHVVLGYEELCYNAVNPGRFLFGLVEGKWAEIDIAKPVMSSIKSRVIQTKMFAPGDIVGFLGPKPLSRSTRLAILPIGFGDGFNHLPPLGEALVKGQRVPILARRGIEHTVIDVTEVPDVKVGSEAVFLGSQGNESIGPDELAAWVGLPVLELLPRLARTLPKIYLE